MPIKTRAGITNYHCNIHLREFSGKEVSHPQEEVMYFLSRVEDELYDRHQPKFFLDLQVRKVLFEKTDKDYLGKVYTKYIERFKEIFPYEFKETR